MRKTLIQLLACGALAASTLAQAAPPARAPVAPAVPESDFWVSLDMGAARATSFYGIGANLGFYGSQDDIVYGLRTGGHSDFGNAFSCIGEAFGDANSCKNGGNESETALLLGRYLDPRHRSWAAVGVARVDGFSERDNDRERIEPGLAMELVTSPHNSWFGGVFRLSANLNEHNSFAMLSAGFRIGKLR